MQLKMLGDFYYLWVYFFWVDVTIGNKHFFFSHHVPTLAKQSFLLYLQT